MHVPADAGDSPAVPVDGHVHLYRGHDLGRLFRAAAHAFREASEPGSSVLGVLCLTEDRRHHTFGELANGDCRVDGWAMHPSSERESLYAESGEGERLLLLSGFQSVTSEGLEVLALATAQRPGDGRALGTTVLDVSESGGVPVLPWAFGKWWASRGACLRAYMQTAARPRLFLGDNSGRPDGLPGPEPGSLAVRHELAILPGSDPLPLAGHEVRVGSYGFYLDGPVDLERPAQWVREALAGSSVSPPAWGKRTSWPRFLSDQFRLRSEKGRVGAGAR